MLRCLARPLPLHSAVSTKINKGLVSSLIIFSGHLHIEHCHHGYQINHVPFSKDFSTLRYVAIGEALKEKTKVDSEEGEKHQHLFSR